MSSFRPQTPRAWALHLISAFSCFYAVATTYSLEMLSGVVSGRAPMPSQPRCASPFAIARGTIRAMRDYLGIPSSRKAGKIETGSAEDTVLV